MLGKDQIDLVKIIASLMIFSGVYMASRSNSLRKNTKNE
jgi:hypothetical protein